MKRFNDGDSFWRTRVVSGLALLGFMVYQVVTGLAQAQTPTTRPTPCDPATAWNSLCLTWTHDGTDSLGMTFSPLFRVEQKAGTAASSAPWVEIAKDLAVKQYQVKGLAPGTYLFRVYAKHPVCPTGLTCTESAPGVGPEKAVTGTAQPSQPILIIAATLKPDGTWRSRIVYTVRPRDGEVVFTAPESARRMFAAK